MSKIEEFKRAKFTADRVKKEMLSAMGRDSPDNDKHRLTAKFLSADGWGASFFIEASYGYFGNSSGYKALGDKDVAEVFADAIAANLTRIAETAIQIASRRCEESRKAAEEEAREVLKETASP